MMQNTAEETITHRHSLKDKAVPVRQHGSFHPGTGTGGAGEHWGGASFRFLPDVFTLRTHLLQKHGAAKLPEDLSIQDWAVTYDDLEPRYWKAEQMMGISGKSGNLRGQKIDGGNIFEGPRRQEYPTPPLKHSYASSMFEAAVRRLGYHPYPTPAAQLERTIQKSGRHYARRLPVLRPLPAVRLHGWRQSAAEQRSDAGARATQEFPIPHGKLGA